MDLYLLASGKIEIQVLANNEGEAIAKADRVFPNKNWQFVSVCSKAVCEDVYSVPKK